MIQVFVYGTLMPGYRNHERFIAPHLLSSQPATVAGWLYDLPAGYPGVVEGDGIVHGNLLELPGQVLDSLDELEGYDPLGEPGENEYYRKLANVRLSNDQEAEAWVYFMTRDRIQQMHGIRVESGYWVG